MGDWVSKVWNDPVASGLIVAAILAVLSTIWASIHFNLVEAFWRSPVKGVASVAAIFTKGILGSSERNSSRQRWFEVSSEMLRGVEERFGRLHRSAAVRL